MRPSKILLNQLSWSLLLITAVMGMDVDHDHMGDDEHSGTAGGMMATNTSELSTIQPTAHEMKHHHGLPILNTTLTPAERLYWESYNTTTYFTIDSPNKSALWVHIATLLGSLVVIYPIALILNNVKSKWYLPVLLVNFVTMLVSLISLKVFSSSAPDLYPGNAYAKMSWIFLFALITHFVLAVLYSASKWVTGLDADEEEFNHSFVPLRDMSGSSHSRNDSSNIDLERLATEGSRSPSTLIDSNSDRSHRYKDSIENRDSSQTPTYFRDKDSLDLDNIATDQEAEAEFQKIYKPTPLKQSTTMSKRDQYLNKVFGSDIIQKASHKFHYLISFLFTLTNLPLLGYMLVYVGVGTCVGNLMGQGTKVFNLLAHFIKGGVFVLLGLFSLARYCGALSKSGLAWNKAVVFKSQVDTNSFWYRWTPHGMVTMEFYESFLIFFYGTTNVFLEHLASEDGTWTAKDLQHASIAFMFIGSGLCGLITEHVLSEWRFNQVLSNTSINPAAIHAGSPGYSPNPFPVFTIFWTGILMSQHAQASETSTLIHMQWGYLLSFGSFFRLLTFILLMLVPNKNLTPARPFTELITSFALICGGFIFMQSTDQIVEALEYRGLTSMFILNVNVGIVALVMGWEMLLMVWKYWLQSKRQI
ncbi:putative membrane protein [Wickerhamomyces ciferrii]|uniref:Membrane protein n=1 Tax=Wickerhamomyces ciferrii (strain ATCC 14091 / BCRC 22168 / CBS 111 / JCM 3599 / NBRC 0793 / NRRL Y-1031 F-60-10) TaxID=1206466 RepID=K0KIK0_WICCF|nr:uncharacterized protein BN7_1546 [Wickerhamomyces ciferrii]CCH42007.1 putative membrane protein [Wickerhamomyces ciferrii]